MSNEIAQNNSEPNDNFIEELQKNPEKFLKKNHYRLFTKAKLKNPEKFFDLKEKGIVTSKYLYLGHENMIIGLEAIDPSISEEQFNIDYLDFLHYYRGCNYPPKRHVKKETKSIKRNIVIPEGLTPFEKSRYYHKEYRKLTRQCNCKNCNGSCGKI